MSQSLIVFLGSVNPLTPKEVAGVPLGVSGPCHCLVLGYKAKLFS